MYSDGNFLVCSGFYDCGRIIYSNALCMKTPSFVLRYNAAISASDTGDITLRMMVNTICTTTVFKIGCNHFGFFVIKKCLTGRLCTSGSENYEASLWIARIVLLSFYWMTESRCVSP